MRTQAECIALWHRIQGQATNHVAQNGPASCSVYAGFETSSSTLKDRRAHQECSPAKL